ncbi:hypothetical protein [Streptomyces sp. NBC_01497]|uniref:hypothetical protein n=1 Tax=Streptomyces sp. NBC_01497 TaxID=2903885 RepID=UPI002E30F7AF|nr:hypothetical protein [Streptomyces sp. NBC_01497]
MDTISKQYEKQCERHAPRGGNIRYGRRRALTAMAEHGGKGPRGAGHHPHHGRNENEYEHTVQDDDQSNDYGGGAPWES